MRWIVMVLLVTAAATAAFALNSALAGGGVRFRMLTTALTQRSVHWTNERWTFSSFGARRWTADVTAESGREWIRGAEGWYGGTVHLRLVGGIVYVRGDHTGLRYVLGLTEPRAEKYAGRWISIPEGDKSYARMADGLTLTSIVRDVIPQRALSASGATWRGTRLLVLRGEDYEGDAHVRIQAHESGESLPHVFSGFREWKGGRSVDSGGSYGRFSKWNEPVHVHAPASSTTIAVVRRS